MGLACAMILLGCLSRLSAASDATSNSSDDLVIKTTAGAVKGQVCSTTGRRGTGVSENGEFRAGSRSYAHKCPRGRAACPYSRERVFPAVLPNPAQGCNACRAADGSHTEAPPCKTARGGGVPA